MAANIILPDKGDSTWAFNNQLFRYITGVFTAKAMKIPINKSICDIKIKFVFESMSK
jgi:hypothetical protein